MSKVSKNPKEKILLVAGGTGGHVFPALAVANELRANDIKFSMITDRRGIKYFPSDEGLDVTVMPLDKKGSGIIGLSKYMFQLSLSFFLILPKVMRAGKIIGFSGFPTLPALIAARLFRKDYKLQEQNAVLGRVNRLFFNKATRIYWSLFGNPQDYQRLGGEQNAKFYPMGLPLRSMFMKLASQDRKFSSLDDFRIVITGGSQGAQSFAKTIPAAFSLLSNTQRAKLSIIHQVRLDDQTSVASYYETLGFKSYKVVSFIEDMATELLRADLLIARSGAGTCYECIQTRCPSILVPYPYATDNHQFENAKGLAMIGGAWLIEHKNFKARYLSNLINDLILDRKKLFFCSDQLKQLRSRKTEKDLVKDLCSV